jgi:hypothetical protein
VTGHDKYFVVFIIFIALLFLFNSHLDAATIDPAPLGNGSLPARFFSDGTVCLVDPSKSNVCGTRLLKIPKTVMKAHSATFYGVFDVDGDGSPEVFIDHWSPFHRREGENVVLLVYKKIRGKYRQYLRLKAESHGYNPGAWFLNESPYPKAVFMTRSGGSSGSGLFYLNLKKKSLDLISGPIILEGHPEFVDMNGDGISEVFLPGRGRDRTSQPGAALLRWKENGYEMWWPNWTGTPNVIYAVLADVDGDMRKEIIAVLEPGTANCDRQVDGEALSPRELAVWKLTSEGMVVLSRSKLPDAKYLYEPTIGRVPPDHLSIELKYVRTVDCSVRGNEMTCGENK